MSSDLAWPCSQGSKEHTITGFARASARLKKLYPGKVWRFENVKLKTWSSVLEKQWEISKDKKFKRMRGLRLHWNTTILREEWWLGGRALRTGSASLLHHRGKANLFLFLVYCLIISLFWCSAILPILSQQKSVLKWDVHAEYFFFPLSGRVLEKSRSNQVIKAFFVVNPLWLMTRWAEPLSSFFGKFCLQCHGVHNCSPSMFDSSKRVSFFNVCY